MDIGFGNDPEQRIKEIVKDGTIEVVSLLAGKGIGYLASKASPIIVIKWYATKWYKCNSCGCLWEFNYPDFPAKGFVKKYENGKYTLESL